MNIAGFLPWGKEKTQKPHKQNQWQCNMDDILCDQGQEEEQLCLLNTQPTGFCLFLTQCNIIPIFTV